MPSGHAAITVLILVWLALSIIKKPGSRRLLVPAMAFYMTQVPAVLYSRMYLLYHHPGQVKQMNEKVNRSLPEWPTGSLLAWSGI